MTDISSHTLQRPLQIIRTPTVAARIGVSGRTIARLTKSDPTFPRPVRIGTGMVGWLEPEITEWIAARAAHRA